MADPAEFQGSPTKLSAKQRKAYEFPVGSRFMLNDQVYYVRKAYFEMNTHMRLLHGSVNDEIVHLENLRRDAAEDENFKVLA